MKPLLFDEEGNYHGDYLNFRDNSYDNNYFWQIINGEEELIGKLEKIKVGRWMSWCLLLEEECYLSAGCLDEVREMIRLLNSKAIANRK